MKTRKITEKYDQDGKLVERVIEETETLDTAPFYPSPTIPIPINPWPQIPYYPPIVTCGTYGVLTQCNATN